MNIVFSCERIHFFIQGNSNTLKQLLSTFLLRVRVMNIHLSVVKESAPLVKTQQKYLIFSEVKELLGHSIVRPTGGSHRGQCVKTIRQRMLYNCDLFSLKTDQYQICLFE
jgi:hypothetical protein